MSLKARTGVDPRSAAVYFKQQLFEIWDITQKAKANLGTDYEPLMRLPLGYSIINQRIANVIASGITEQELADEFYSVFGGSGTIEETRAAYQALKADVAAISNLVQANIAQFIPGLNAEKRIVFNTPLTAQQTTAITNALDAVLSRFE